MTQAGAITSCYVLQLSRFRDGFNFTFMLDVGMGYVSLSLHLVWMLFGMPSLHPFTFLMFLLPYRGRSHSTGCVSAISCIFMTYTTYRIAGNFRWCKFLQKSWNGFRINFRIFYFRKRARNALPRPLTWATRTRVYTYYVAAGLATGSWKGVHWSKITIERHMYVHFFVDTATCACTNINGWPHDNLLQALQSGTPWK